MYKQKCSCCLYLLYCMHSICDSTIRESSRCRSSRAVTDTILVSALRRVAASFSAASIDISIAGDVVRDGAGTEGVSSVGARTSISTVGDCDCGVRARISPTSRSALHGASPTVRPIRRLRATCLLKNTGSSGVLDAGVVGGAAGVASSLCGSCCKSTTSPVWNSSMSCTSPWRVMRDRVVPDAFLFS